MMTEQGRVLSALLQGAFICQVTDEEAWRFLKSRDNAAQLEPHLALLNRTLSTTAEGILTRDQLGGERRIGSRTVSCEVLVMSIIYKSSIKLREYYTMKNSFKSKLFFFHM